MSHTFVDEDTGVSRLDPFYAPQKGAPGVRFCLDAVVKKLRALGYSLPSGDELKNDARLKATSVLQMPYHEHWENVPVAKRKARGHVLVLADIPEVYQLRDFFTSEITQYMPRSAFITDNRKKAAHIRPGRASRVREVRARVHGTE